MGDAIIGPKNQRYIFKFSKNKTNLFDDYDDINDINNVDNEDQQSFSNINDIEDNNDYLMTMILFTITIIIYLMPMSSETTYPNLVVTKLLITSYPNLVTMPLSEVPFTMINNGDFVFVVLYHQMIAKEIKGQLKIDVEDDDITVTVNGDFFEIVLTFPEK
ncbi:7020_t:CDS:2 [Entrophospora sp. SA101]|nr:7017_t:CDS:2 [Entrophospora sp. SA101]CAJ0839493.1 7020_t:CDS:2 [Entrophospora sp. SA101]